MSLAPAVSVVIAAWNAATTLPETLASVANQTWRDFELIVVDDGSTDSTPDVLATHAAKWPWLQWHRQKNAGVAAARNRAVELARGEFIATLDADDLWLPEKLALQMQIFAENPSAAVVYADEIDFLPDCDASTTRFQDKPPARGSILRKLFMGNFISTSAAVVRKSAFEAVGGFNPEHRLNEDVDLFLRLAEQFKFDYVDKVLVRRRILPTSLMHANSLACQRRDLQIFDYWVNRRPDLFPEDSPQVRQRRGTVYARMGRTLLSGGDYRGSRQAYRQAIRLGQRDPEMLLRALAAHLPLMAEIARRAKLVRNGRPAIRSATLPPPGRPPHPHKHTPPS